MVCSCGELPDLSCGTVPFLVPLPSISDVRWWRRRVLRSANGMQLCACLVPVPSRLSYFRVSVDLLRSTRLTTVRWALKIPLGRALSQVCRD